MLLGGDMSVNRRPGPARSEWQAETKAGDGSRCGAHSRSVGVDNMAGGAGSKDAQSIEDEKLQGAVASRPLSLELSDIHRKQESESDKEFPKTVVGNLRERGRASVQQERALGNGPP